MRTINVKDLMAIAGKPGLFKYLAQARNGVVVESLTDKKRTVAPPTARVSALEDISVFSDDGDVPLADVLMKIYEKEDGGKAIDQKSANEELKAYFLEAMPDYDDERVYVSDIKKVIAWYNLLQEMDMLEVVDKKEDAPEDESNDKTGGEAEDEDSQ